MDTDLDSDTSEGNSPEPIFKSIISAMGSNKEATADQIYRRIQQDGVTNFSKPQVDRALANALQYGIFEVRNNRFRVRDDVLDDEDTIYWQAHIKREKTPYRLENHHREYINPEKDQHTFRRMFVSDGEGCNSCKRAANPSNSKKGRGYNQKSSFNSNKNVKDSCGEVQKMNAPKPKKVAAMKRQPVESRQVPVKRMARNAKERDTKKRKKMRWDVSDYNPHTPEEESDSDESSRSEKWNKKRITRKDDDEVQEDDDEEDFDLDDDADQDECSEDPEDSCPPSSFFDYMKEPYASKFLSRTNPCGGDTARPTDESDSTAIPNENRNLNFSCKPSETLQGGTWCGKVDWLVNRPENTEDGTVKQFDNGLKIEPLDSLPFKNMEEPSYIS